jgi:Domain of unknown function (DUF6265)
MPSSRALLVSLLLCFPFVGAESQSSSSNARPTASLDWLAGCWERRNGPRVVEEHWLAPRGGLLLGMSRTTRGDSLVEFEQVRIYEVGDTLVYAAMPSRQAPAEFRAAPPHRGDDLTFANPAHDFPQRIRYRRIGSDSLVARIEGESNGATRGIDFAYRRVACVGSRAGS